MFGVGVALLSFMGPYSVVIAIHGLMTVSQSFERGKGYAWVHLMNVFLWLVLLFASLSQPTVLHPVGCFVMALSCAWALVIVSYDEVWD